MGLLFSQKVSMISVYSKDINKLFDVDDELMNVPHASFRCQKLVQDMVS